MNKSTRKPLAGRDFYLLLVLVLSCNMVLWLDSFDRYLSSRYHFYLSQYLPDAAYAPSERVQQALGLGDGSEQAAAGGGGDDADAGADDEAAPGPLPVARILPASAVIAQGGAPATPGSAPVPAMPASAPVQTGMAGAALAAASAPAQAQAASAPAANGDGNDIGSGNTLAAADSGPKILFAGDSMMQGVAPIVISRLRKLYPHGLFVDVSKESTGLTVNRYFDWPTKIRDECVRQGLRTVVIFLGPNDPWDIYEHRRRYVFPSDKWEAKYRSRVDEVLDFAAAQGLRVIWIGLPVMREDRIQQGARIENKIFQEETKKYKFDYLPTEDLLGSLDQPYKKYIDDPKKGKVVVRADDGVHFTSTGLRMISSRVEELLRKQGKL
jgi:hypothetical protein